MLLKLLGKKYSHNILLRVLNAFELAGPFA